MKSTRVGWIVAIGLVLALPAVAAAQGVYVGIHGGPAFGENVTITGGLFGTVEREYSGEFGIAGAVGYAFTIPVRVEAEFTYLRRNLNQRTVVFECPVYVSGGILLGGSGHVEHFLYMANVYYDVIVPFLGGFKPYVGAGLGYAGNTEQVTGPVLTESDRHGSFAYQFKGGIAYALTRSVEVSAGYRYIHIGGDTRGTIFGRPLTVDPARVHMLEFGVAYKF